MGVYADQLTDINAKLERAQYEYDCIDGTKSVNIKIYLDGGVPAYTQYARDGVSLVHEWTGTGGLDQMAADWRSANSSATSGTMFDIWTSITNATTTTKNTEKGLLSDFITYLTKKQTHYQAIVDNGEDPSGLHSLEDLATIEASAP
tara:strand:+ start:321 stop:761 length:441 start_codon:yes stop_codon:yes gene_type:complete